MRPIITSLILVILLTACGSNRSESVTEEELKPTIEEILNTDGNLSGISQGKAQVKHIGPIYIDGNSGKAIFSISIPSPITKGEMGNIDDCEAGLSKDQKDDWYVTRLRLSSITSIRCNVPISTKH